MKIFPIFKLIFIPFFIPLWMVVACSSSPPLPDLPFAPNREQVDLRQDIYTLKAQWIATRCPKKARRSQCEQLFRDGVHDCLNLPPAKKSKCIYTELYCTLYGGFSCGI